ncbi:thioredoxin-like protein [Ochromonadaceae sp. CCMP2298]|nr:thioredoxin-like protein [Ochromonadaceae sp. CCMP2298]
MKFSLSALLLVLLQVASALYAPMRTVRASRLSLNMMAEQLGRVTMYKKEGCPYCEKAKTMLENEHGLKIDFVDIEEPDSAKRDEMIQQMRTFTGGRNTVPQIFFNSEHLGGNDDVETLNSEGKLAAKVEMVKTTAAMMMDHWFHPWY